MTEYLLYALAVLFMPISALLIVRMVKKDSEQIVVAACARAARERAQKDAEE